MSRGRVVPIVEGHGEQKAIRVLLDRTWRELLGGEYLAVLSPFRVPRGKLVHEGELERAVRYAAKKLDDGGGRDELEAGSAFVLVLLDADKDPVCDLVQTMHDRLPDRSDLEVSLVVANKEYETWFVAAAESLAPLLSLKEDEAYPSDPEAQRQGKKWIADRMAGGSYSETVDQPKLTSRMDLELCRKRSPSFDKLCRELERRIG